MIEVLHAGVTLMMTGVIWVVQVCLYPLFAHVGDARFLDYHRGHSVRISFVVVPLMIAEFGTAIGLAMHVPQGVEPWWTWLGLGLLLAIWAATFLLAVPKHRTLSGGFEAEAHRKLVAQNWIRTALWSARSCLALIIAHRAHLP